MLQVGQKYHKNGVTYEVKKFTTDRHKIKISLENTQTKEIDKLDMTITSFVSQYSKLPDCQVELIKGSPS